MAQGLHPYLWSGHLQDTEYKTSTKKYVLAHDTEKDVRNNLTIKSVRKLKMGVFGVKETVGRCRQ